MLLIAAAPVHAAKLYKWVDEEGNVHYTDVVPPEAAKQGREELTDQGVTVRIVEPEKTPEQLEEEQKLAAIMEEERRRAREQAAYDRMLLATFSSVEDMKLALEGKLFAIESVIQATNGLIKKQKKKLAELQSRAAELERAGRPVPATLQKEIETVMQQIAENQRYIDTRRAEQDQLRERFANDIRRFSELKASRVAVLPDDASDTGGGDAKSLSVVDCEDILSCNKAWSLAQIYTRRHATTRIQLVTDSLITTFEPREDDDISITVSKIPGPGETAQLSLDVQCKSSEKGRELCRSPRVQRIKADFKRYIEGRLQ